MHWVRNPRLNSAVATVAVLMVLSLLRVASLSLVMCSYPSCPSFRGAPSANPESRDSGSGPSDHPGMTGVSINHGLADRRAKIRFEEVKVAALIGLPDVAGEHPAIAALEAGLRLFPCGAALCQLRLRNIEIDAARGDVERDAVAVLHERQRPADIGFRRDMQDAGAVAGAAHARIRHPHHVAHALFYQFGGNRQHAPL